MPYKSKKAQREYQRNWIKARRDEFFTGRVCEECGSGVELNLHHTNPQEKLSHKIWSWAKDRRELEIRKCRVLCQTCHNRLHAKERIKLVHGTITMYNNHKCRCDLCRKTNADRTKRQRMAV